ncbi:MAG: hypothetical protein A2912_04895 [Candidatus Buchananbacteria bacterium RIFCSPLOWO2_01_FULL_40_23b]|uniref:Uncharacterized protein n=1 Tax=Candidatus Buchananbacteria bacterium RIFCSPLOWO2_01_FULL_40_23b TaxID=1797544 RepID=A0A1G1YNC7_9BACT|nr:MAG: hypothetical protein A2912_04895 [Candidatus Buchananbacteria bacterium RIFCSPLOWO2_01_FULL_40_23b]
MNNKFISGLTGLVIASTMGACSDNETALSAARAAGFKNVEVRDTYFWLGALCQGGEKEYQIMGENNSGKMGLVSVCCGYTSFKKCTVRY